MPHSARGVSEPPKPRGHLSPQISLVGLSGAILGVLSYVWPAGHELEGSLRHFRCNQASRACSKDRKFRPAWVINQMFEVLRDEGCRWGPTTALPGAPSCCGQPP